MLSTAMTEEEISSEDLEVLQDRLKSGYQEREERATQIIQTGQAVDNPLLTGVKVDDRYSITSLGFLSGTAIDFLQEVQTQLQAVEPEIQFVPKGFNHISLQDLEFNQVGRKVKGIDAAAVRAYYQAVRNSLTHPNGSIDLQLFRIIPVIDRPQNSVSVVAAFLPKEDAKLSEVRKQIYEAIIRAGFASIERPGGSGGYDVIFSTLGRFPHPPRVNGGSVPFLSKLAEVNEQIPTDCSTSIDTIDVVSTRPGTWADVSKHVYLTPISLVHENLPSEGNFLRPAHIKNI